MTSELTAIVGGALGGIGLFLLGMWLMTDGLKLAAGPALERILAGSTRTRVRGLFSGALLTAIVQSSSAVTVAAIGFVNAGLLNLSQAIWVLFGANVGTTMTGWLVALVGLEFKIEAAALPLIGGGMLLRITGAEHRRGAIGMTLAGFGVLFLGINLLKDAFGGFGGDIGLPGVQSGVLGVAAHVVAGIVLTVLMQSSSAALAIALTAAQGGAIAMPAAAAVVIGANVGTTVTALLAAAGATPDAKRAAGAHIVFNIVTGVVAIVLMPLLLTAIVALSDALKLGDSPAAKLALFHTVFNVLGVACMWPFGDRLSRWLEGRFQQAEEGGRPRYLDANVLAVPALALDALEREVRRAGSIALGMVRDGLAEARGTHARDLTTVTELHAAIGEFIVQLHRGTMSQESAERLPEILRVSRYYETVAELADESVPPVSGIDGELRHELDAFRVDAEALLGRLDPVTDELGATECDKLHGDFESRYQRMKARLLVAGASGEIGVRTMEHVMRAHSALRRAVDQAYKAARLLGTFERPASLDAEDNNGVATETGGRSDSATGTVGGPSVE